MPQVDETTTGRPTVPTGTHDPELAAALLDLDAAQARLDELTDRVTALELDNRQLRKHHAHCPRTTEEGSDE